MAKQQLNLPDSDRQIIQQADEREALASKGKDRKPVYSFSELRALERVLREKNPGFECFAQELPNGFYRVTVALPGQHNLIVVPPNVDENTPVVGEPQS